MKSTHHRRIYLDHAATTPVRSEVIRAMKPFFGDVFGNPSSVTQEGVVARRVLETARQEIAHVLGAHPDEIVYTSGGTEANNLAIAGSAGVHAHGHVVAFTIEHQSVLEPIRAFERRGGRVTWVKPDRSGLVHPEAITHALEPETVLVSVQYANNEIGTIQPIAEIARTVNRYRTTHGGKKPFFHSDACQAPGFLPLGVEKLGVDFLTVSAQKFYGPKGAGFLFVRRGVPLEPLLYGGGHERGLRAGTENVPGIVGMSRALVLAEQERERKVRRLTALRDRFIHRVLKEISGTVVNGSLELRLASNVNISFAGVDGELLVLGLDAFGVAASTGSACGTRDHEASYVVSSLGVGEERSRSAVRFTLGIKTTERDLNRTVAVLKQIIKRQRRFS